MTRRSFVATAACSLCSPAWPETIDELPPFAGPDMCAFEHPSNCPEISNLSVCMDGHIRSAMFRSLPSGDIPSWQYNTVNEANFSEDWGPDELMDRLSGHLSVLFDLFRIAPPILRSGRERAISAIPAWRPSSRTPGIVSVPTHYFDGMEGELSQSRATGGWRVAALFALAHELAHVAVFSYPAISASLARYPACFNELVADFCASAYIEYLKVQNGYNRIDAAEIVQYFENRRHCEKSDFPTNILWHGSSEMRIQAVNLGARHIHNHSLTSGLSLLRDAISDCTTTFDTSNLREAFACANISWDFDILAEAHQWAHNQRSPQ